MLKDPNDMTESRERRELDRLKIVKKIWHKQLIEDIVTSEESKREWQSFANSGEQLENLDIQYDEVYSKLTKDA